MDFIDVLYTCKYEIPQLLSLMLVDCSEGINCMSSMAWTKRMGSSDYKGSVFPNIYGVYPYTVEGPLKIREGLQHIKPLYTNS